MHNVDAKTSWQIKGKKPTSKKATETKKDLEGKVRVRYVNSNCSVCLLAMVGFFVSSFIFLFEAFIRFFIRCLVASSFYVCVYFRQ